jgi:cyclopropane fatty-acyl-phospholipid synthase-like methyltransferase
MATTAGYRLTLDPMRKCSNAFFSETTNMIKAKQSCRSRHFEFHIGIKNVQFVEDHPMNIHVQFGFNHICSF